MMKESRHTISKNNMAVLPCYGEKLESNVYNVEYLGGQEIKMRAIGEEE